MSDEINEAPSFVASAGPDDAGQRIDRFLAAAWPDLSRARISALIQAGDVVLAAGEARSIGPAVKVRPGDRFIAAPPPPIAADPTPEPIPLDIVYEDIDLVVVAKPAGMTVHPAPGQQTGTLVNALLHHCGRSLSGVGGVARPGIVHRIDKDTSGLLVVAKHDKAHQGLARQFEAHTVERVYQALVWGAPGASTGRIEGAIGRDPRNRKRMAVQPSGKDAVTHYQVTARFGVAAAEISCRLETGRTHQIRVHLTHAGWPLIGDPVYGRATAARRARLEGAARGAAEAFPRQALHAAVLGFEHPVSSEPMRFERPPPTDMAGLKSALESGGPIPT